MIHSFGMCDDWAKLNNGGWKGTNFKVGLKRHREDGMEGGVGKKGKGKHGWRYCEHVIWIFREHFSSVPIMTTRTMIEMNVR